MLPFQIQSEFYNQPFLLSEDQAINPASVHADFFTDYNLSEVREILASITETCLTCDSFHYDTAEKRADFIHFQKKLEWLLEAAFMVAKNQPSDNKSS
jgi:hypothetical protein